MIYFIIFTIVSIFFIIYCMNSFVNTIVRLENDLSRLNIRFDYHERCSRKITMDDLDKRFACKRIERFLDLSIEEITLQGERINKLEEIKKKGAKRG